MKKLVVGMAAIAFVLGTVACGGAGDKGAKDASDDKAGEQQKSLEKFEGNKMEAAEEDE